MEKLLKEKLPAGKFLNVNPTHSRIMQGVRSKRNKTTEVKFRLALVRAAISKWKMNYKGLHGCPDFFFPKEKVAIFIDGCFWHGCQKCGHIPKKNTEFWRAKFLRNKQRDTNTTIFLKNNDIHVIRFWEHEIRTSLEDCILVTLKELFSRRK